MVLPTYVLYDFNGLSFRETLYQLKEEFGIVGRLFDGRAVSLLGPGGRLASAGLAVRGIVAVCLVYSSAGCALGQSAITLFQGVRARGEAGQRGTASMEYL
jgi:hypothetical protein